jgi:hypothetical protein
MRKSAAKKEEDLDAFLDGSAAAQVDNYQTGADLHQFVRRMDWPVDGKVPSPSLADGSDVLSKQVIVRVHENIWNSIDRHTKTIGVSKAKWLTHAILKLMEEEQLEAFGKRGE